MSPAQESKHWRLWRAACQAQGWKQSDNARRYAEYAAAMGSEPAPPSTHHSLKEITNQSDIDKVFDHFTQLASNNTDLKAAYRQANPAEGDRKRLTWSIQQHDEALWRHIAQAKFRTSTLADLSLAQLTQLRNTCAARASAQRKKKLQPAYVPF